MTTKRRPSAVAVTREQLLAIGVLLRPAGALLLGLYLVLGCIAVKLAYNDKRDRLSDPAHAGFNFSYTPQVCSVFVLVAIIAPLLVWQDEDPSRRGYHRAMPVGQSAHALLKVVAGWIWLTLFTALFLLAIIAVHGVTSQIAREPQPYHPNFVWWEWLVPFTSITIAYLFASAAAVGTRRPLVWIAGVVGVYIGVGLICEAFKMREFTGPMDSVLRGFYGASAAIGGEVMRATDRQHDIFTPSLQRWLGAASIWGGAASGLMFVAAKRRYERS